MADSSYPVHLGESTRIDSRTAPDGDHRPVVVVGDATAANTLAVDASGRPTVNVNGTVPVSGTVAVTGTLTSAGSVTSSLAVGQGTGINFETTASTNASLQKAASGSLLELCVSNVTATALYVKVYNKATAPTVGTDKPILTIPVPANTTICQDFGPTGKRMSTGIGVAVTAAAVYTDVANAVAGVWVSGTYI